MNSLHVPVVGILLAGGRGSRYSQHAPHTYKLLAQLPSGQAVVEASANALATAVDHVVIVVHPERNPFTLVCPPANAQILITESAKDGMGSSLAAAAHSIQTHYEPSHVIVALADMPWIQRDTYSSLCLALQQQPVVTPIFEGQRGHPVGFQASLVPELAQLKGDQGAKSLVKKYGAYPVMVTDPAVLWDVDYPSDLAHYSMARDT